MAVPSFGDPSFAKTTGLTEPMLRSIISASEQASRDMLKLRGEIDVAAENIRRSLDSDAGIILQGRLSEWHGDYQGIINNFDSLTNRSQQLLQALIQADADSKASAGSGQA